MEGGGGEIAVIEALEAVNRRLDWAAVGRELARPAIVCQRILSRIILARPTSKDARYRPRIAAAFAHAIRAANFQMGGATEGTPRRPL